MSSNLTHLTESKAAQLLADRSRRADIDAEDLSAAHAQMGTLLGAHFLEGLPLEEYPIQHCQGTRTGLRIADEASIGILVMLRAGLYLASGLRPLLRRSPMLLVQPKRGEGLSEQALEQICQLGIRHAVIVDAVVNTGASIVPIFAQLGELGVGRVTVLAGVAPKESAISLAAAHPSVHFLYARLSTNTYVGKGGTDTGNRLFGTEGLD